MVSRATHGRWREKRDDKSSYLIVMIDTLDQHLNAFSLQPTSRRRSAEVCTLGFSPHQVDFRMHSLTFIAKCLNLPIPHGDGVIYLVSQDEHFR